ncbi:DUF1684 domain-containing protein [Roseomonas elaeocarpi]|uniref:DUF1684 domain-containing protein n=1 Tax=Roseomonas elaeocarpi TaxID=907779 RepID=A0ABV6JWF9_9PROT
MADLYAAIRAEPEPERAWQLWRDTRAALFRSHPQSPIEPAARAAHPGPRLYPYDPALRFAVTLRPPETAEVLELPAGADGAVVLDGFARTEGLGEALGGELVLYWMRGYGGGVFLPFADATSGRETYGAGRYLLDTIKSADLGRDGAGRTVLDFNFSYFPSCAYSPRYTCPLAPRGNRLPMAVRAGERLPEG